MPGQDQLRSEEHLEEKEQPQPRGQHRPPLARRMRRAEKKSLEEGSPREQSAEEPAPWAKSQAPRARQPAGGESQWKCNDAPQPARPAAERQEGEGKIAPWKRPIDVAQRQKARHNLNGKRSKRRLRTAAKWAKGGQQQEMDGAGLGPEQAPESDTSQRSRRSRSGAGQEPADSPEPDVRGRSRRPRDARSQSRSHSTKRSPRR